jgi:hypothetical protein
VQANEIEHHEEQMYPNLGEEEEEGTRKEKMKSQKKIPLSFLSLSLSLSLSSYISHSPYDWFSIGQRSS